MLGTMAAPKKLTVEEFLELYADEPYELIDGVPMLKTSYLEGEQGQAAPLLSHGRPQLNLGSWLARRFDRSTAGRWPGGWIFGTEATVIYAPARIVFVHDLAGWRRDRVQGLDLDDVSRVRPDWVGEILSPGHEKRDLVTKMEQLYAFGVPHYWVIDREEKRILAYERGDRGFAMTLAVASGEIVRIAPFDAVELRTSMVFGEEPDEE
jgi:Uma2 family endonuclease